MNSKLIPAYAFLCTFFLLCIGSEAKNNGSKGVISWQKQTIVATVADVIPDSGLIALEGPNGRIWTLAVDRKVNLSKYKKGDHVRVTLYQGEALDVRKPTQQDRQQPFVVEKQVQPPQGTNPVAGTLRQIRALVKIIGINRDDQTVTIEGPRGNSYVVYVKNSSMLDSLQVGQEFVLVFTEGVAAEMQKL